MSKLSKQDLKMIVKECLVEILAEGIVNTGASTINKKRALSEAISTNRRREKTSSISNVGVGQASTSRNKTSRHHPSYLDNIKYGSSEAEGRHPQLKKEAVNRVTKTITKDPVMQSILADTARTTLQEQVESGRSVPRGVPPDKAAQVVDQSDPTELFGESSKNWATLAFGFDSW